MSTLCKHKTLLFLLQTDLSHNDDDYALSEISVPTSVTTTTTFSNPVYDMDSMADEELHRGTGNAHPDTPSTSRATTP
jgi:hypothetical protein